MATFTTTTLAVLQQLAKDLRKEQGRSEPDPERCRDLLQGILDAVLATGSISRSSSSSCALQNNGGTQQQSDVAFLQKTVASCCQTFRLLKRRRCHADDGGGNSSSNNNKQIWNDLIELAGKVSTALLQQQEMEPMPQQRSVEPSTIDKSSLSSSSSASKVSSGLPSSVSQYLARLKQHDKEIYKNPPVLPPATVTIEANQRAPLPKREATTGRLTFATTTASTTTTAAAAAAAKAIKEFHPNTTPEEILRGGAFGGTYFRSIHSAVTNKTYTSSGGNSNNSASAALQAPEDEEEEDVLSSTVDPAWMAGLDGPRVLTSFTYRTAVNKFRVKCGGSLGMWESSGWISDADPYGWFQWYCRFYQGRRSSDDARQIARWKGVAGPKGRFKSQLCNKILAAAAATSTASAAAAAAIHDASISPVIRQTLFHWGLLITDEVLDQHKKQQR